MPPRHRFAPAKMHHNDRRVRTALKGGVVATIRGTPATEAVSTDIARSHRELAGRHIATGRTAPGYLWPRITPGSVSTSTSCIEARWISANLGPDPAQSGYRPCRAAKLRRSARRSPPGSAGSSPARNCRTSRQARAPRRRPVPRCRQAPLPQRHGLGIVLGTFHLSLPLFRYRMAIIFQFIHLSAQRLTLAPVIGFPALAIESIDAQLRHHMREIDHHPVVDNLAVDHFPEILKNPAVLPVGSIPMKVPDALLPDGRRRPPIRPYRAGPRRYRLCRRTPPERDVASCPGIFQTVLVP